MQGEMSGSFFGTVTDDSGEGLPGVVVTARNESTGAEQMTVTREDGNYVIMNEQVGGPYQLTAVMTGFKTAIKNNEFVKADETTQVNFQLSVAQISEI